MVSLLVTQRYRADDADTVTDALQAVFGTGTATVSGNSDLRYAQTSLVDDGVTVTRITSTGTPVQITVHAAPELVVFNVRSGSFTLKLDGEDQVLTSGGLALLPLLAAAELRWEQVTVDAFSFPQGTLRRLMGSATWTPRLHADRTVATSEALIRLWRRAAATLADEVLRRPELFQSDLIRDQAVGAVLACTIEAFGISNRREDQTAPDTRIVHEAGAYMNAHLDESISIGEIASALGISIRGLQLAFHRTGEDTPLLHLRQKRMAAAHDALTEEYPDTVAEVARQVGYTNLGRFSSHYRQAFDQFPSATLRTARTATRDARQQSDDISL